MSKLTVSVTTDFSASILNNVKLIDFTNPAGTSASALFVTRQFGPGPGPIRADVAIDGSAGVNHIIVSGNSISAARWTFSHWGQDDMVTIKGTTSFDEAEGSIRADRILGFTGDDFMFGMAGSDEIWGGAGADRLVGDAGDDVVFGGGGKDDIQGDSGRNILSGGRGNDRITSNSVDGGDSIDGGAGFDVLAFIASSNAAIIIDLRDGGGGRGIGNGTVIANMEQLNFDGFSSNGNDLIMGGSFDDSIFSGRGNDRLRGLAGDDHLIGGAGTDVLRGGSGDDTFISPATAGVDHIEGGRGTDTVSLAGTGLAGKTVDISDGGGGRDIGTGTTLSSIEVLFFSGGGGDDRVTGGSDGDRLGGGGGNNALTGGAGDDVFVFDKTATGMSNTTITDFTSGGDTLDVSAIDATPGLAGNRFTFVGSAGFTMTAGELGYIQNATGTIVLADLSGDGVADLMFTLASVVSLTPEDFEL